MKVQFDTETIKLIGLFQEITGAHVKDTLEAEGEVYFVVAEGEYGLAIGKGGAKIKKAERAIKKPIKIFEYAPELERFIRNAIPEAQQISVQDKSVRVKINSNDRARVIGKAGYRAKLIGEFLARLFDVESFKVF